MLEGVAGLTATQAELVVTLRRGEMLVQVGRRSFLVQLRLSSQELALVDTDARMRTGDQVGAARP